MCHILRYYTEGTRWLNSTKQMEWLFNFVHINAYNLTVFTATIYDIVLFL